MTRFDTLRLLLAAEIPTDLETIEASLSAMSARIDTVAQDHELYAAAHRRLDELLAARDHALHDTNP